MIQRRILSGFLCTCMLLVTLSGNFIYCSADTIFPEYTVVKETNYELSNGCTLTVTISEVPVNTYATQYSKIGQKTYTYCNSIGSTLFHLTVHGTFSVKAGVNAVCTAASHSYSISNSSWSYAGGSSRYTGNQAIGNGTFEHTVLFITVATKECEVILSCDANENLS